MTDDRVAALNRLWTAERALIDQYVARSKVARTRGDGAEATAFSRFAMTEMMEVSAILDRIIAIGGVPELHAVPPVDVGGTREEQVRASLDGERATIAALEGAASAASAAGDPETEDQLRGYLAEQHEHVAWLEARLGVTASDRS